MPDPTTDPVIPPEAVEAAAKAQHGLTEADWSAMSDSARAYALAGVERSLLAALPHLRPLFEVDRMTRHDAAIIQTIRIPRADWQQIVSDLENMCGCGREQIEILQSAEVTDEGQADDAAARWAQMYSDAVDNGNELAQELRQDLKVATQVGLELGRREAGEEIAKAIGKLPTHADGRQIVGLDMRLMAEKVAPEVATRTADARTGPSGPTDLPPTPDAGSKRYPEETP